MEWRCRGGVVHRLDVGEANAADDENAEQRRHEDRNGARQVECGGGVGRFRLGRESHLGPIPPSTRGRGSRLCRRQVSWLAGRRLPSAFPEAPRQWPVEGCSPLTVAGAAAESGKSLTAFPFSSHGMREPTTGHYSGVRRAASGPWRRFARGIDKGAPRPLKCLIDGRSDESKQGTRYGFRPIPRPPRNCKRRARTILPLGDTPGRRGGAETREPGDLPSIWSPTGRGASGAVSSLAAAYSVAAVQHPIEMPEERLCTG